MPAHSPFTQLCQAAIAPPKTHRADLHLHSTASDGRYTPAQVVELARRTGLAAIALSDHDTMAGYEPARLAAAERIDIIPAVELSCERAGREVHLLAYFVRPGDADLNGAMERMRKHRVGRYSEMVAKLGRLGVEVVDAPTRDMSLGRRHLADELFAGGDHTAIRAAESEWDAERLRFHSDDVGLPRWFNDSQ